METCHVGRILQRDLNECDIYGRCGGIYQLTQCEMGCIVCVCVEMLTSQVSRCDHPAVQLQFFETVVRYEKFFGTEPQFLPDVLVSSSS